jgi:hypothetical protein
MPVNNPKQAGRTRLDKWFMSVTNVLVGHDQALIAFRGNFVAK